MVGDRFNGIQFVRDAHIDAFALNMDRQMLPTSDALVVAQNFVFAFSSVLTIMPCASHSAASTFAIHILSLRYPSQQFTFCSCPLKVFYSNDSEVRSPGEHSNHLIGYTCNPDTGDSRRTPTMLCLAIYHRSRMYHVHGQYCS